MPTTSAVRRPLNPSSTTSTWSTGDLLTRASHGGNYVGVTPRGYDAAPRASTTHARQRAGRRWGSGAQPPERLRSGAELLTGSTARAPASRATMGSGGAAPEEAAVRSGAPDGS